ncbi:MAG: hypothetical protein ABIR34_01435 [Marmoricola sp.]
MTVRIGRDGPVTAVTIDRPEARNAVDGPTAGEIEALPQTCLRQDRLSVLEQWGLSEDDAMDIELGRGRRSAMCGRESSQWERTRLPVRPTGSRAMRRYQSRALR